MMYLLKKIITGFFILVVYSTVYGQYNFFQLNTDNGLTQNSVESILQDDDGYLWISTADGLNRFDGYQFDYYKHSVKNKNSIAGILKFRLIKDAEKQLWILHNKGISKYNKFKNEFLNYNVDIKPQELIGRIEQQIYFIDEKKRVIKFNTQTNQFETVFEQLYDANFEISKGGLQLAGKTFALKTNENEITITDDSFQINQKITFRKEVSNPFLINDSLLLCLTKDSVYLFLKDEAIFSTYKVKQNAENSLIKIVDAIVYEDKIWLGSFNGIYILNYKSLSFEKHIKTLTNTADYTFVYDFYIDRFNNLWVGSNTQGLFLLTKARNKFKHLKTHKQDRNMIKSICITDERNVITGQYGSHLTIYDTLGNYQFINLGIDEKDIPAVWGVFPWQKSQVLVHTNIHLIIYDYIKNKIIKQLKINDEQRLNFPTLKVYGNEKLIDLNIKNNSGIYSIDAHLNIKLVARINNDEHITDFVKLKNNKYLIGSDKNLYLFESNKLKIIEKMWVKCILKARNDNIYIGETSGLHIYSDKLKLIKKLGSESGLKNEFIYGILEDHDDKIWFSHNRGISVFNPLENLFIHFDKQNGLQANEFNTGAYCKDKNGILYFGGINGLNIISPSSVSKDKEIPNIHIRKILVNNEIVQFDTLTQYTRIIKLPYYKNNLSFDFGLDDYSITDKNEFRYQLLPLDKDEINLNTKHELRFANLNPGNYHLIIKGKNSNETWSQSKTFNIIITPPFWETPWFYAVLFSLFILTITFIVYNIIARNRKKLLRKIEIQQKIENERIRISRDLHDHLGAHITYLINKLDVLEKEKSSENDFTSTLKKLKVTSRNTMQTLRETIWAMNSKNLNIEDFSDRLKQYILKLKDAFPEVDIKINTFNIDKENLPPNDALQLFRICQESIQNAFKHSEAENIEVNLWKNKNWFTIEIKDDGKGFDLAKNSNSNQYGIKNMKSRAAECNAEFEINSTLGNGTTIKIIKNLTDI